MRQLTRVMSMRELDRSSTASYKPTRRLSGATRHSIQVSRETVHL
jgi:hypothetical protein